MGTLISALPSIVGTSIVAPSTASEGVIGTSVVKSSPVTVKFGCDLSCNLTNKSPGSAPPAAACRTGVRAGRATAKNVAQVAVLNIHTAPTRRRRKLRAVTPIRPKLVVTLALFRVGEHFVGFVDGFEAFLGGFISGIQIRVV